MTIELGNLVRDRITGFVGVSIARTMWRNNMDRILIQPRGLNDEGQTVKSQSFDVCDVELVEKMSLPSLPLTRPEKEVWIGDTVRDRITNIEGTVMAWTQWLAGCSRMMVQPHQLKKDGTPADMVTVDEVDCVIVKRPSEKAQDPTPIPPRRATTGGPRTEPVR